MRKRKRGVYRTFSPRLACCGTGSATGARETTITGLVMAVATQAPAAIQGAGTTRPARAVAQEHPPLPRPLAALLIGALSAGLWLGLFRLAAALF